MVAVTIGDVFREILYASNGIGGRVSRVLTKDFVMPIEKLRIEKTKRRLAALSDNGIKPLGAEILEFDLKIARWLWLVPLIQKCIRTLVFVTVVSLIYFGTKHLTWPTLALQIDSWNELISVGADGAELLFLTLPICLGVFFAEKGVERRLLLPLLNKLENYNDRVYDLQMDTNPYESQSGGKVVESELLEFLDVCTALLLVVRMSAHAIAESSSDRMILERVGIVRRGAGDNHTRILIKIGIFRTSTAKT